MIGSSSVRDTLNLGRRIAGLSRPGDIVCLFGGLGSGKTVLTQGIAWGLGVSKEEVISPTFVLLRQYQDARLPLYHFDLYRLKGDNDVLALGYEEYLYGSGISVIEWASRLKYLLPKQYLEVELLIKGPKQRSIKLHAHGSRYRQLLKELYAHIRH
ncbi:MAG: tRNA (adenosine(37)-N6)-threonylcarbamoyltransferase complex ATPase subunit type 1 TsaE [Candidatus Omnitrophota bacterium]|jgi:tRNA threonylcarbamoyladenosine biosynthesis protein TsaE